MSNYLRKMTTSLAADCHRDYCAGLSDPICRGFSYCRQVYALFFLIRNFSGANRLSHCFLFSLLSVSLFLINILRNDLLTGLAMGLRPKNDAGIFKILENFGGVFCDWLSLERKPVPCNMLSRLQYCIIFIITILFPYRRKKSRTGFEYVAAVTGLTYCIFMVVYVYTYPL